MKKKKRITHDYKIKKKKTHFLEEATQQRTLRISWLSLCALKGQWMYMQLCRGSFKGAKPSMFLESVGMKQF